MSVYVQIYSRADQKIIDEYSAKCQSCGACCSYYAYHESGLGVPVDHGELIGDLRYTFKHPMNLRLQNTNTGVILENTQIDYWMKSKKEDGWKKCIALEGHVGVAVNCTVYEKRPPVCVDFLPGSDSCLKARRWAKIEEGGAK